MTEGERYQRYQGHLIRSGARLNPGTNQWTPTLTIFWDKGQGQAAKTAIVFRRTFSTEQEAERCAHRLAVDWIDAGKPELPLG
jgi:hypothetical protein